MSGAYLFNPTPPFAVTHFSPEPIIPLPLYGINKAPFFQTIHFIYNIFSCADEKNGWAFKSIDFIVFPVGLLSIGDSLLVTVGRNDNSGWAVVMNTAALVDDLLPVKSSVVVNKFHKHEYFSLEDF